MCIIYIKTEIQHGCSLSKTYRPFSNIKNQIKVIIVLKKSPFKSRFYWKRHETWMLQRDELKSLIWEVAWQSWTLYIGIIPILNASFECSFDTRWIIQLYITNQIGHKAEFRTLNDFHKVSSNSNHKSIIVRN